MYISARRSLLRNRRFGNMCRNIRIVFSKPTVSAINVHRPAMWIAAFSLSHGFKIASNPRNSIPFKSDKVRKRRFLFG